MCNADDHREPRIEVCTARLLDWIARLQAQVAALHDEENHTRKLFEQEKGRAVEAEGKLARARAEQHLLRQSLLWALDHMDDELEGMEEEKAVKLGWKPGVATAFNEGLKIARDRTQGGG